MERRLERVLVTGGEGFLGRYVKEYLSLLEIPFDTLDLHGVPTWRHDITFPLPSAVSGYSHIIHMAGLLGTHELFGDVMNAIDVNIKGTINVLNLARKEKAEFRGITMDHVWVNPYETTKLAAERLGEAWGREYDFPVKYTTVYNAFGEHQAVGGRHPQKIVPTFALRAFEGKPIPVWGDGEQVVDLIYAGVIAHILVHGCDYDGGRGIPMTVNEVAEKVWNIVRDDEPRIQHLPMRMGEHTPTHDPVADVPFPESSPLLFERQLERTVLWYRNRKEYP